MTYEEKRRRVKERVNQSAKPLTEIVREMDKGDYSYPYSYVSGVLNGEPGKKSNTVLDRIKEQLSSVNAS